MELRLPGQPSMVNTRILSSRRLALAIHLLAMNSAFDTATDRTAKTAWPTKVQGFCTDKSSPRCMSEFDVYEDSAGEYRWRLTSGSDIIADSGEGYSSEDGARQAVSRVQGDAAGADVLEVGTPHFDLFEDQSGEYRWRLVSSNGRIIADSGEGYSSKGNARRAIETVQGDAGSATVSDD